MKPIVFFVQCEPQHQVMEVNLGPGSESGSRKYRG